MKKFLLILGEIAVTIGAAAVIFLAFLVWLVTTFGGVKP